MSDRNDKLRRADFTAAPLPLWRSGAVWQDRPMPWWRELVDALKCAVSRLGPQRLTPIPNEKKVTHA